MIVDALLIRRSQVRALVGEPNSTRQVRSDRQCRRWIASFAIPPLPAKPIASHPSEVFAAASTRDAMRHVLPPSDAATMPFSDFATTLAVRRRQRRDAARSRHEASARVDVLTTEPPSRPRWKSHRWKAAAGQGCPASSPAAAFVHLLTSSGDAPKTRPAARASRSAARRRRAPEIRSPGPSCDRGLVKRGLCP